MQRHLEELKRGGRPMTKTEIKLNNLNKGIDELIKKYEDEINEYDEFFKPNSKVHQLIFSKDEYYAKIGFIQDLKKLKGE